MIADRLHWIRDMDYDEDRSQVRSPAPLRAQARPATTGDHEVPNDFAGAPALGP